MSIYLATLPNIDAAAALAQELIGNGIESDALSIVSLRPIAATSEPLGDATAFVGRDDDPASRSPQSEVGVIANLSSTYEATGGAGIDTSDIETDVDTVDQAEDSQSLSEDMLYPPKGISQSTHEGDDLALTVLTGFPTAVPLLDDVHGESDQFDARIQAFSTDRGTILGGGGLATAALDVLNPDIDDRFASLTEYLRQEGVPQNRASTYLHAIRSGGILLAVEVLPGGTREPLIESTVARHQGENAQLFDVPRFHNAEASPRSIAS